MRFTNYTRFSGNLADALNLEALLEGLGDFLLQSGFAGGQYEHPWWGGFGDEDADRSLDALKNALLKALLESGMLTPEMVAELRGQGEGDEEVQRRIAELLDRLIERMVEEGFLSVNAPPRVPDGVTEAGGRVDQAREASRQVEFSLTGKGVDFLGYRTLRGLLGAMGRSSFGSHDTPYLATGVEAEAASRPYEFGDVLNLDVAATLKSALGREGLRTDGTIGLEYGDLHVHQAEYRSSCATVLLLDTSHSMILYGEDRFTPAKKVALALTHLIRTQFPGDSLKVVTFGDRAEEIALGRMAHAQVGPFHTNTAEGLKLARRLLLAQNKEMRQIVMITDGKPSAVTLPNGEVYKNSMGLDAFVLRETFHEVGACRKAGILINTFMLARDPALVAFVNRMTQIARGKAYFTNTMTLGQYIMRDFLRRKTRRAG
ncbi:MAG: von Willebrand factor type [Gemmatimonadetes bacterium]|nr:von Willebrand factor type [Gemmatimonadota bacterium]